MKTETIRYNATRGVRRVTLLLNGVAFPAAGALAVQLRARNISGGPPKLLGGVGVAPVLPATASSQFDFDFSALSFSESDCGTWVVDIVAAFADGAMAFPCSEFSFLRVLESV